MGSIVILQNKNQVYSFEKNYYIFFCLSPSLTNFLVTHIYKEGNSCLLHGSITSLKYKDNIKAQAQRADILTTT